MSSHIKAQREGIDHITRIDAAKALFNQQLNHIKSKTLMSRTSPFVPKTWQDPEEDRLKRVA